MHDCTGSVIAAAEITSLAQVCIYWFFLYIFTLFGIYYIYLAVVEISKVEGCHFIWCMSCCSYAGRSLLIIS